LAIAAHGDDSGTEAVKQMRIPDAWIVMTPPPHTAGWPDEGSS
jgi:hypothetical protein